MSRLAERDVCGRVNIRRSASPRGNHTLFIAATPASLLLPRSKSNSASPRPCYDPLRRTHVYTRSRCRKYDTQHEPDISRTSFPPSSACLGMLCSQHQLANQPSAYLDSHLRRLIHRCVHIPLFCDSYTFRTSSSTHVRHDYSIRPYTPSIPFHLRLQVLQVLSQTPTPHNCVVRLGRRT